MCRECGCAAHPHTYKHRHPHHRHFLTKEEKIEKLENYAKDLKKELTAVEERIKELEG